LISAQEQEKEGVGRRKRRKRKKERNSSLFANAIRENDSWNS